MICFEIYILGLYKLRNVSILYSISDPSIANMKLSILIFALSLSGTIYGQTTTTDTWSNVPQASDDRFTNPKKPLYAGPNGWYNFGEVRVVGTVSKGANYAFKGGLSENSDNFSLVEPGGKLRTFHLDFGTADPPAGVYQVGRKSSTVDKKVAVSFSDVSDKKIRSWAGAEGSGSVTVSKIHGFSYFKCRNVVLNPNENYNTGDLKQTVKVGFEGAFKP